VTATGGAIAGEILPAGGPLPTIGAAAGGGGVLEQLRREWLIGYASANTRAAYDRDLGSWLAFLDRSGVDPLTGARTVHAHAWLRTLEAAGEASATRGRRLAAVSAFYKWLIAEGHTERANPAAIDPKRKPKPPKAPATASLTRGQAQNLVAAADADTGPQALRTAAIVALLLFCGLRVSELVDADVDGLGHDRGHRVLRFTSKGGGQHVVAIPPPAGERLDAYLASRDDLARDRLPVALGSAGARPRRPLLVTDTGGRLDRGAVSRLLRRLARAAGIDVTMSPHVLRHTYATLARDAGVPLDDVQDGLGHADPRTTRRYDHGGIRLDRSPGYTLARELAPDHARASSA
jgi:integrase/recombinase XerD